MKLALIQMSVKGNKLENLRRAKEKITEAARAGAQLVMLPEMFCCPYSNDYFTGFAEKKDETIYTMLQSAAAEDHVLLIGGSFPEKEGNRIYNTCFVFDERGEQIARHRKIHLFDINVKGGQYFKESDTFTAGDDVTVFECGYGKFGVGICFDIRFPELFRCMMLKGAQAIFVPAAFNMTTGPAHWELAFRQRAVDNQLFMAGCSPAKDENGVYVAYGNSIVTSPWGTVLARAGGEETILYAQIELSDNESIREQLPLLSARRTDVYMVTEHRKQEDEGVKQ